MRYYGIPTWPPDRGGPYQGHDVFPTGEDGVLYAVERINEDARYPKRLILTIEFRGNQYSGDLWIEDGDFLEDVFTILKKNKGKDLTTIGQLEI